MKKPRQQQWRHQKNNIWHRTDITPANWRVFLDKYYMYDILFLLNKKVICMKIARTVLNIADSFRENEAWYNANLTLYDMALDSLDKVSIVLETENQCHVTIPDVVADRWETPSDIIVGVRNLRAKVPAYEIKHVPGIGGGMCVSQKDKPTCVLDMQPCPTIQNNVHANRYDNLCRNCTKYQNFIKSR